MIGKGDLEYSRPFYPGERRPHARRFHSRPLGRVPGALTRYSKRKAGCCWPNRIIQRSVLHVIYLVTASPLLDIDGKTIGAIESIRDITDRKETENRLSATLGEKEILLKEVHHRVKNNMQIISSLLTLQDSKAGNDELHRYFQESIDRIHAMGAGA
ncbi:MAG: histidine kinase dimerization/phosphoacceptor domain -containing protein [Spirochaetota bacterium]